MNSQPINANASLQDIINQAASSFRSQMDTKMSGLEKRVGTLSQDNQELVKALITETNDAQKARSDLLHGKQIAKIAGESVGAGASLGTIGAGIGVCFIPVVGLFIGIPLITAGVAGTATSTTFLGIDAHQEVQTQAVICLFKEKLGIDLPYSKAQDYLKNNSVEIRDAKSGKAIRYKNNNGVPELDSRT